MGDEESKLARLLLHLPVLEEARDIDLLVTKKVGNARIMEYVCLRIADFIEYHLPRISQKSKTWLQQSGRLVPHPWEGI